MSLEKELKNFIEKEVVKMINKELDRRIDYFTESHIKDRIVYGMKHTPKFVAMAVDDYMDRHGLMRMIRDRVRKEIRKDNMVKVIRKIVRKEIDDKKAFKRTADDFREKHRVMKKYNVSYKNKKCKERGKNKPLDMNLSGLGKDCYMKKLMKEAEEYEK